MENRRRPDRTLELPIGHEAGPVTPPERAKDMPLLDSKGIGHVDIAGIRQQTGHHFLDAIRELLGAGSRILGQLLLACLFLSL
jgi:hypothetical protein